MDIWTRVVFCRKNMSEIDARGFTCSESCTSFGVIISRSRISSEVACLYIHFFCKFITQLKGLLQGSPGVHSSVDPFIGGDRNGRHLTLSGSRTTFSCVTGGGGKSSSKALCITGAVAFFTWPIAFIYFLPNDNKSLCLFVITF